MGALGYLKQLAPGFVCGFACCFAVTAVIGVNESDMGANVMGIVMGCLFNAWMNVFFLDLLGGKAETGKFNVGKAALMGLPYLVAGVVIGYLIAEFVLVAALGIDLCAMTWYELCFLAATVAACLGAVLGFAYLKIAERKKARLEQAA